MNKMTAYLPDGLKRELVRTAREQGRSGADNIREGIRLALERSTPPMPTLWTFTANEPDYIDRIDALLEGFGEQ